MFIVNRLASSTFKRVRGFTANKNNFYKRFYNNNVRINQTTQSYERVFDNHQSLSPIQKAYAAMALGGGSVVAYYLYNKEETAGSVDLMDDVTFNPLVRERVANTYKYIGSGFALTAVAGFGFFRIGLAKKLATMNPWLGLAVTAIPMIGTMLYTTSLDYNDPKKQIAWATSMAMVGASLSPLTFLGGAIVMQAGIITCATVGVASLVAANAPSQALTGLQMPLSIGVGLLVASGFGTMLFPGNSILMNIVLYGGLGIFSAFLLVDTQRLVTNAKMKPNFDPINESYHIYLDAINIFVRLAQILAMSNGGKRR